MKSVVIALKKSRCKSYRSWQMKKSLLLPLAFHFSQGQQLQILMTGRDPKDILGLQFWPKGIFLSL